MKHLGKDKSSLHSPSEAIAGSKSLQTSFNLQPPPWYRSLSADRQEGHRCFRGEEKKEPPRPKPPIRDGHALQTIKNSYACSLALTEQFAGMRVKPTLPQRGKAWFQLTANIPYSPFSPATLCKVSVSQAQTLTLQNTHLSPEGTPHTASPDYYNIIIPVLLFGEASSRRVDIWTISRQTVKGSPLSISAQVLRNTDFLFTLKLIFIPRQPVYVQAISLYQPIVRKQVLSIAVPDLA
jgi:hypothetical protein